MIDDPPDDNPLDMVNTLTFDLFGTVLDLAGSLTPHISEFLSARNADVGGPDFWNQWRARQRIEQYQDTTLDMGHSGYLTVCRYAFLYVLRSNRVRFTMAEADEFMKVWQELDPFDDAVQGLNRLKGKYRLVGLSNGEPWYLEHLAKNRIKFDFDAIISVEEAGHFKPHPSVYRKAARILHAEPGEIMMVASHSFDLMGARACGYRAAYVNRYGLPTEETPFQPDLTFVDFNQVADYLVDGKKPVLPATLPLREE